MSILSWIILGLIAGALAKLVMPGDQGGGIFLTMLLGIVGALVGGFIGTTLFGWEAVSGIDMRSILIAMAGALIVLFVWGLATRRR